eukprot:scaffold425_cov175-Amphora_coffeaeformis.AAC.16
MNHAISVTNPTWAGLLMKAFYRLMIIFSFQKLASAFTTTNVSASPSTSVKRHPCISSQQRCTVSILHSIVSEDSSLAGSDSNKRSSAFVCHSCQENFTSRNALFRHLRTNAECGEKTGAITKDLYKQSIAIQFAYYHHTDNDVLSLSLANDHLALQSGKIIEQSLVESIVESSTVQVVSRTQSSIAKLRPEALEQEPDIASTGDVLVLTLKMPQSSWTTLALSKDKNEFLSNLQGKLDQAQPHDMRIMVTAVKFLSKDHPLHAERSCTQLAYQYLLPFEWLPGGEALHSWTTNAPKTPPQTELLRVLKKALRSAESKQMDSSSLITEPSSSYDRRIASGRFGALAQRERRAWHNYSAKRVSPNHDTAWRVIDRCRIVGFTDGHAIVEARGDEFLQGQLRAIVGTAVAVANGWLPQDAMQTTTIKDLLVAMPLAPAGRTYLADVKFHFDEMRTGGNSVFESSAGGTVLVPESIQSMEVADEIRLGMLKRLSTTKVQKTELEWLKHLQEEASPAILSHLRKMTDTVDIVQTPEESPMPADFVPVFNELSSIVGSWPETSSARQGVIKGLDSKSAMAKRGSFTIVNPEHAVAKELDDLPLGNARFPGLVKAVFELEKVLGAQTKLCVRENMQESHDADTRPPSSHCAVNCDAQFTPHVDSGRGKGQQLSMIVGLGSYSGGELFVEGRSYDIRYKALEFDGWKLRHWTAPFRGQRFSLVWFTPDME